MKKDVVSNKLLQYKSFFWLPDYVEQTSAWTEHIPFGFWIVEVLQPKVIVELGVHLGTSYFAFCQAVKDLPLNALCYGIDSWQGDEQAGFYGNEVFETVTAHNTKEFSRFSNLVRSTFDEATGYFIDKSVDLLHIDGLHTYEAVKHDFEVWLPKLSDKAIVIIHDINVRERNFGVFKLWEELKARYQHFQFDFGYGLGVLAVNKVVNSELNELFNGDEGSGYYDFLTNIFAERGNFFRMNLDQVTQIKMLQQKSKELFESNKHLESCVQELRESH